MTCVSRDVRRWLSVNKNIKWACEVFTGLAHIILYFRLQNLPKLVFDLGTDISMATSMFLLRALKSAYMSNPKPECEIIDRANGGFSPLT